jgi:hypothetical protein
MALYPAASVEQLVALLRHHLLADSAVAAIVGGRVHGAHLQDADARTVAYPLTVLELEGGFTRTASAYQNVTAYLYAYHRDSQGEALRLYDAMHAALQHQLLRRDGVPVAGYCMETARPDYGWNERCRAWYARGLWAVRTGYREGQA